MEQVIWAIRWWMILIAPLVFLPIGIVVGLGVAVALGHPILSELLQSAGVAAWARVILLDVNQVLTWGETAYIVSYPILPWFGLMAPGWGGDPLDTLGRAPLFFYVLHLYALWIFGLTAAGLVSGLANLGPPPQQSAPNWLLGAV